MKEMLKEFSRWEREAIMATNEEHFLMCVLMMKRTVLKACEAGILKDEVLKHCLLVEADKVEMHPCEE